MKKNVKKDALMQKFQNSALDRVKLEKISGGGWVTSPSQDIQTGLMSDGNHDNNQTPPDRWYNGGSAMSNDIN